LLDDENDVQVEAFLRRYPHFSREPLGASLPETLRGPALRLTPRAHGTDGFYAAVLVRAP
jgi:16S rRNA (cytosine967-C5)-methyltransferase